MMKLKRFIAVSLLLVITMRAYACWWEMSHAGNVLLYRVMPLDESDYNQYCTTWDSDCMLHHGVDYKQENLKLWQLQTSTSIPLEDIEYVVYKVDIRYLQDIRDKKEIPDQYENAFLKWINAHKRKDIIDLLILAKQNEHINNSMTNPWYYRVEDSYNFKMLADIVEKCQAYKTGVLLDRYALQTIRALCTLREYQKCVAYWDDVKRKMPNNVIKKIAELKAASALYKVGRHEEASEIYAKYGDVNSIRVINGWINKNEFEFVYEHHPNSPYLEGEIQKWLIYYGREWIGNAIKHDNYSSIERFNNVLKLAHRAVKEKKSKKLAMWYYTLASLYDIKGEPYKAKKYLEAGSQYHKDPFLRDSYRVLQMWLDAQTATYDSVYEQRLYLDLRWLVDKIKKNVPSDIAKKLSSQEEDACYYDIWNGYHRKANTFYWNDAMRRVLLRVVCPRMHEVGKYTREIQLANIAENLLIRVNDYSNEMFLIMDRLSYKATRDYFYRVYHPQDDFDEFLNSRGKVDKYYWYDILATKCLRECRYNKAIVYLSQIPLSFQRGMHVYGYMGKDPFSYDMETFKYDSLLASNYKLQFAEKMATYQRKMKNCRNINERASSKIQYALGLRNSVHKCWFLTRYSSNWNNEEAMYNLPEIAYPEDSTIYRHEEYLNLSDKLINEAINTFTDKEQAARELRHLLYYKRIINEYGDTETAKDIRQHCDRWRDYAETKERLSKSLMNKS